MSEIATQALRCGQCGTGMAPSRLSCPACHSLVYADELKALAQEAQAAGRAGDGKTEITTWRRALDLLPPDSKQALEISRRVDELSRQVSTSPFALPPPPPPASRAEGKAGKSAWKGGALVGAGLLLWKFKAVFLFLLPKAKLLFLGLTKSSTLFSMLLSLGVYWAVFGWWFALGILLSLYVHEMGHVAALQRYGLPASFPMFVPGLGAFVRLKQRPANPVEDARIGLAGPFWGLGAAVVAYGAFLATGWPILAAVAKVGAWINLFNLLPVWQLDGGRAFNALSRPQRWIAAAGLAVAWIASHEGLLVLLAIVAGARAWGGRTPESPEGPSGDRTTLIQYLALVALLTALCLVDVPELPKVLSGD